MRKWGENEYVREEHEALKSQCKNCAIYKEETQNMTHALRVMELKAKQPQECQIKKYKARDTCLEL